MARVSRRIIAQGKHLQLLNQGGWEYADRVRGTGVVAVIAVTPRRELILTKQFRVPVARHVIDLPAGLAGDIAGDESEAFEQAARRELLEETGFDAQHFEHLFTGPSSAGMTTEMISFFLADQPERIDSGGGDGTESIEVLLAPLDKISAWLDRKTTRRTCIDPKVYAAIGVLALHQRFRDAGTLS